MIIVRENSEVVIIYLDIYRHTIQGHLCIFVCLCVRVCVCIRMEVVLSIQVGAGVINTREAPKRNTPNVAPSSLSIAPITMVYR